MKSQEQKQGTARAPCTQHPKGWADHLRHPPAHPGHPYPHPHREAARLSLGSEQGKLSFVLTLSAAVAPPPPQSLAWASCLASSQFLLIKENKNLDW